MLVQSPSHQMHQSAPPSPAGTRCTSQRADGPERKPRARIPARRRQPNTKTLFAVWKRRRGSAVAAEKPAAMTTSTAVPTPSATAARSGMPALASRERRAQPDAGPDLRPEQEEEAPEPAPTGARAGIALPPVARRRAELRSHEVDQCEQADPDQAGLGTPHAATPPVPGARSVINRRSIFLSFRPLRSAR